MAAPDTEQAWLAAIAGKTVREIEDAVRGRRKGDGPGADPDPAIEPRLVSNAATITAAPSPAVVRCCSSTCITSAGAAAAATTGPATS